MGNSLLAVRDINHKYIVVGDLVKNEKVVKAFIFYKIFVKIKKSVTYKES